MSSETAVPPPVLWAQRKDHVYVTIGIECKTPNIKIEKDSIYFQGVNAQDSKVHEVTISLYSSIDPKNSTYDSKGRCIQMVLSKENMDAPYWPSLTSDKKKPHYLKIDFNKWRDEDEEDDKAADVDLGELLKNFGNRPEPNDVSLDDLESDSDDENLPDLE